MAISYTISKHGVCFPSRVLAANGGANVLNFKLAADCDNGNILGKGDYVSLDLYNAANATTFTGKVVEKAANGNYYVEVATASNAYVVCNVVAEAEDWTNTWKKESNSYNPAGSIVRVYEAKPVDIFEFSAECFTSTPSVGDSVSLSGKKLAI